MDGKSRKSVSDEVTEMGVKGGLGGIGGEVNFQK